MEELVSHWQWFLGAAFAAGIIVARVEYLARRTALAHTRIDKYKDEIHPCLQKITDMLYDMDKRLAVVQNDVSYLKKDKNKEK